MVAVSASMCGTRGSGVLSRDTSLEKIQRTQNEALRIITGSHKMLSIDMFF